MVIDVRWRSFSFVSLTYIFLWRVCHFSCMSMVVDFLFLINIVQLLECENSNLKEGDNDAKDEPDIHHPNIRSWWKFLHNADKKCRHHQHHSQVYSQCRFKKELLKKSCAVANKNEEDCGKVCGEDLIGQPSLKDDLHLDSKVSILWMKKKTLNKFNLS